MKLYGWGFALAAKMHQYECSSEHNLLYMPRTRHQLGDRAFSVAAPSSWNVLLHHLTLTSMTTATFKEKMKIYIQEVFVQHFEQWILLQRYINVMIMIIITSMITQ